MDAIDVKWLSCDFAGCKRKENGECSHCGFHAAEMDLLRIIGQGYEADAIIAKYTEKK